MNSRCVVGRLEEGREVEGDGERRETVHALFFSVKMACDNILGVAIDS